MLQSDGQINFVHAQLAATYGVTEALVIQYMAALGSDMPVKLPDISNAISTVQGASVSAFREAVSNLVKLQILYWHDISQAHSTHQYVAMTEKASKHLLPYTVGNPDMQESIVGANTNQDWARNREKWGTMPIGWELPGDWRNLLLSRGLSQTDIDSELPLFRNYWIDRAERRENWGHIFYKRMTYLYPMSRPVDREVDYAYPSAKLAFELANTHNISLEEVEYHWQVYTEAAKGSNIKIKDYLPSFRRHLHEQYSGAPNVHKGNITQEIGKADSLRNGGLDVSQLAMLSYLGIDSEFAVANARNYIKKLKATGTTVVGRNHRKAVVDYIKSQWQEKQLKSQVRTNSISRGTIEDIF